MICKIGFKQLILQLPICICIVQRVTWEIGLPSFIETVQGVRSAPHRSFPVHKIFQRLVKENKEKERKKKSRLSRQVITEGAQNIYERTCEFHAAVLKFVILIWLQKKMQTWIPDIYVDLVKNFMKFIEMYGNLVNEFLKFSEPVYSWNFT